VKCSKISQICGTMLKSRLGFPILLDSIETGSSREPKIRLAANSARWFGSSFASDPAQLKIINATSTVAATQDGVKTASELRLVPGHDKLSLNACIVDDLSQVVKGLDYTCRILVCPADTIKCVEDSSLLAAAYTPMDQVSGLFRPADIPLVCPMDGETVTVQVSLAAQDSVSARFSVTCMPCRAGQARTLGASGRAWWCASCSPKQYVINPNNPSFGCKVRHLS
jgi:hypothetical protein